MMSVFLKYDSFKHPIKNIKLFFRHRKWAWQRVHRGYSDFDVGEMASWFDLVIPDMLLQFKNNIIGYPAILNDEFYEEHKDEIGMPLEDLIVSTAEKSPLRDKWQKRMEIDCRQKWKEIIEEMRYYFLESNEDTCTKYPYSDMSHDDYLKKYDEINNYQTECRKKAFDLLCKWGRWLWN